jgi:ADP-ribose pyrophosphatase YjhB (NUDIX family)
MTERKPDAAGWKPRPYTRPVVLGVLRRGHEVLVTGLPDDDDGDREIVYRVPGGGQAFQETMEAALAREFREELDVEISVGAMIGIYDYIYRFRDLPGHDVYVVFEVTTEDESFLARETIEIHEPDGRYFPCLWAGVDDIRSRKVFFAPEGLIEKL